ncbi:MAG: LuxR C-terminal-related transcriptional regulator [Dehalococcoidales bacterium]|nr:LuxR C-terminal-related transcriptional regulator [Dehalococcoidales bacterium]
MSTPILATKLYIPPPRPQAVSRPKLIERLNDGLQYKLTLISAPAGFRKTMLVSEWAANCGRPVAWLSLDIGDNDPICFLTYLVAALQTVLPKTGEGAMGALQSPHPPATETVLTTLLNEIATTPDNFVLVIDDYHVLDAKPVDDALSFLLEHLPPQMHVVVATREDPLIPLPRLRARGQLTELRAADLRFTPDEAAEFLNRVMGLNLSTENITSLENRTEGWITGLQLAALSMQGQQDVSSFIKSFTGSHHFVLDYLVEEVLHQQPESIQMFLLSTSILDRLCGSLCDAVLLNSSVSGQKTLENLERANLFIVPLDNERNWYRYHHLFADLLRGRLAQKLPVQASALHLRAGAWFESRGLLDEAIAHTLAAGEMERTAELIERIAIRMFVEERPVILSRWIDALPDNVVRAHPWLCLYHAWIHHWVGLREQVEEWLVLAEKAIAGHPSAAEQLGSSEATGETTRRSLLGHITAIRAYNMLTSGDLPGVMELAPRALSLLSEGEYVRTTLAIALGGAYWGQGNVLAAQDAFETARANALRGGYRYWSVPSTCYVGMQQTKRALLHEAYETYSQARDLAVAPDGYEVPVAGFPNMKMGDILREWNDLPGAGLLLIKGVEQCARLGQADVLTDAYVALAKLHLAQGAFDNVRETLRKADDLVKRGSIDPFIVCWLEDCRVRALLAAGDLDAAVRWAKNSGLTANGELNYHYDLHHINLARVLVARGIAEPSGSWLGESLTLLSRLQTAAAQAGWIQEEIKIGILQALAMRAQSNSQRALKALGRVLSLAERGGFVRLFVDEGAPMAQLLLEAVSQGIMPDYISKLLAAFKGENLKIEMKQNSPPSPSTQNLMEPLSQRELKMLQLIAQGLSNREISERLFLALSTVKGHNRNIFDKLQVQSRTEAVARARELGLL